MVFLSYGEPLARISIFEFNERTAEIKQIKIILANLKWAVSRRTLPIAIIDSKIASVGGNQVFRLHGLNIPNIFGRVNYRVARSANFSLICPDFWMLSTKSTHEHRTVAQWWFCDLLKIPASRAWNSKSGKEAQNAARRAFWLVIICDYKLVICWRQSRAFSSDLKFRSFSFMESSSQFQPENRSDNHGQNKNR